MKRFGFDSLHVRVTHTDTPEETHTYIYTVPECGRHKLLTVGEDERQRHHGRAAPRRVLLQGQVDVVPARARVQVGPPAGGRAGDPREAVRHGVRAKDGANVDDGCRREIVPAEQQQRRLLPVARSGGQGWAQAPQQRPPPRRGAQAVANVGRAARSPVIVPARAAPRPRPLQWAPLVRRLPVGALGRQRRRCGVRSIGGGQGSLLLPLLLLLLLLLLLRLRLVLVLLLRVRTSIPAAGSLPARLRRDERQRVPAEVPQAHVG